MASPEEQSLNIRATEEQHQAERHQVKTGSR
jgi:hypothetical protein